MILSAYRFADGVEVATEAIAHCAETIRAGGLVGLPTETVYGLGADADNEAAVAQIFTAKGRPADHPLIVHVASLDGGMGGVAHYAERVPAFASQLMAAFWPGPLTLVLPRKSGVGSAAAGGQKSIGLRCPSHPAAQNLLSMLRKPEAGAKQVWGVAAPSANKFGRVSPTTAEHVLAEFGDEMPILDGGACEIGIESTIVDCTRGTPVLLRPGFISRKQIEEACGRKLLTNEEFLEQAPKASGTLESHYAPRAKVRLMSAKQLQEALGLFESSLPKSTPPDQKPQIALYARSPFKTSSIQMVQRAMPRDAAMAAHELFAVLREFDDAGVALIWVETPPKTVEWEGVLDRLQRASA